MCQSCVALKINGILCHEYGCPDAWQDEIRECKWCGAEFKPEEQWQKHCCQSCYCAYNGYSDPDDPYNNDYEDEEGELILELCIENKTKV